MEGGMRRDLAGISFPYFSRMDNLELGLENSFALEWNSYYSTSEADVPLLFPMHFLYWMKVCE